MADMSTAPRIAVLVTGGSKTRALVQRNCARKNKRNKVVTFELMPLS
jgi:hypothetical protein|tara:strand:- start:635 stop:775 length:141 start_codon:yes stop_codon:yes gene_type:complete